MPLISIQESGIYYSGTRVLKNIDLQIVAGERIALLGKSGAGKSTLLQLMYHQLSQQQKHKRLGWIPQQLGLVNNLSVFHNVYMGQLDKHSALSNLTNLIWPRKKAQQEIAEQLEYLALADKMFTTVGELSGGQQQRAAIARALYSDAEIILADEPASSLDLPMAKRVISMLIKNSQTTVIALHDTELAMAFADRIIGIHQGEIVLDCAPKDINPIQLEPLYDHE